MKTFGMIAKILAAIATVAGVVYLIATYGDKIVAKAKALLGRDEYDCDCGCETCDCGCADDCDDCQCQYDCETECPCECACETVIEDITEEVAAEEATVVAEDQDFEA